MGSAMPLTHGLRLGRLWPLPGALGIRPLPCMQRSPVDCVRQEDSAGVRILRVALGLLDGVTTFNFHLHLPHYAVTAADDASVRVLTRQPVDRERPHPFTDAGNTEFNSCLWMPPKNERAGHIVMVDSTIFTTLFGGTDSLANFWRNLARM